jgi:predicted AAA+ superfamily ATPase
MAGKRTAKKKSQLQREKKIYIIDTGFIDLLTSRTNLKEGRLFENVVFHYLRKRFKSSDIFYYRADKGEEVDFLLIDSKNRKMVQVAYNLDRHSTQNREIRALVKAGKKFHIHTADIITFDTEAEENISWFGHPLHLRLLPAWKLFLSTTRCS